jgi:lipid-binding SYLF domain-containing protein
VNARRLVPALALSLSLLPIAAEARLPSRLARKVDDVVRVLGEFTTPRDSEIPADMMDDAVCIAVLPDVTKGAVGIGGRYGKGLVSCRREDRAWGPPAFLEVGGASFGLQIGGEVIDLILVVRNEKGIDYLLRDKFTLGADASVAAGPIGRTAGAATDAAMQAGILSYSRTRGVFAGAALDGAVVKQDRSDNRKLYGKPYAAREILLGEDHGEQLAVPEDVQAFVDALPK